MVVALAVLSGPAVAAPKTPPSYDRIISCRAITDDKARLACFDAGVAALETARSSGEVTVVDRQEVREARRGLFGFNLPKINLFGGGDEAGGAATQDDIAEITGKVASVTRNGDGYYIVTLEDGARWEQIAPLTFGRAPRAGSVVTIKKAALGSYKMAIDKNPAVKARRIG